MTAAAPIELTWIDGPPAGPPTGVTLGVPWPQGTLPAGEPLTVCVAGQPLPTQTWPLAFWPDGSLKWTGVATVVAAAANSTAVTIRRGTSAAPAMPLQCTVTDTTITVDNGGLRSLIGRQGDCLIASIRAGGTELARGGQLLAMVRHRTVAPAVVTEQVHTFTGRLAGATVEQAGPVRVVVKAWGTHVHPPTGRSLFPFTVRLYFYADDPQIQLTHFFVYDGDPRQDFLQAIDWQCGVPLRDDLHNRRVWFGVDDAALWSEHVRTVPPLLPNSGTPNPDRQRQVDGAVITAGPPPPPKPYSTKSGIAAMPVWNNFRLLQDSARQFQIWKSCGAAFTELPAFHGGRAAGLMALTDARGGLGISQRDFWQTAPTELAITDAVADVATVAAWFWSPHAPAADLRHSTDLAYGALYENAYPFEWEATPYAPDWVSASGVGKSSRLVLCPFTGAPDHATLTAQARQSHAPAMLACQPAAYHRAGVFGVWSLVRRTPAPQAAVEDRLTALLDHYLGEVDRRSWYGFWNYGDFRHSYDPIRHEWHYDEGGYGWQNAECQPDLWLWYSFLRTGRADVFHQAVAMSRHNADVDTLHIGYAAGRGTRHNVSHWGCNVKTARVSHAGGRRFLYYLTADEHIDDRLTAVLDHHPSGVIESTLAPDWSSHCWNWLTAWERTGDARYGDKIRAGIAGLLNRSAPFVDGGQITLDINTGQLAVTGPSSHHMMLPFGGPENWMELAGLLHHDAFAAAVAGNGRFFGRRRQWRNIDLHRQPHRVRQPPRPEPRSRSTCVGDSAGPGIAFSRHRRSPRRHRADGAAPTRPRHGPHQHRLPMEPARHPMSGTDPGASHRLTRHP